MATFKLKQGYKRCTRTQLISLIKKYQKELYKVANCPEGTKFSGGKTKIQYGRAIKAQMKVIAQYLRSTTLKEIDWKLKTLVKQRATQLGLPMSSTRVTSSAIKRLKAKRRQIAGVSKISKLITFTKSFKLSTFKNPKFKAKKVSGKVGRRVTSKRRTKSYGKSRYTRKTTGKKTTTKYKTEGKKLRKEISKLKTRNTFLRKQVSKFRKEVGKMQRHFSSLNRTRGGWKVVKGGNVRKEVSNIVRISNALTNAIEQRKAG